MIYVCTQTVSSHVIPEIGNQDPRHTVLHSGALPTYQLNSGGSDRAPGSLRTPITEASTKSATCADEQPKMAARPRLPLDYCHKTNRGCHENQAHHDPRRLSPRRQQRPLRRRRAQAPLPAVPQRNSDELHSCQRHLGLRSSRRHDPHARWREAPHDHPRAQRRIACRHAAHAHTVRGQDTNQPHAKRALGPHASGLRQRDRRNPRGRLHPRGAGCARKVRLGG
jgi:hypothetical protein